MPLVTPNNVLKTDSHDFMFMDRNGFTNSSAVYVVAALSVQ